MLLLNIFLHALDVVFFNCMDKKNYELSKIQCGPKLDFDLQHLKKCLKQEIFKEVSVLQKIYLNLWFININLFRTSF